MIENRVPVPANFPTSRRIRRQKEADAAESEKEIYRIRLEESYKEYVRDQVEAELHRRFPGQALARQIKDAIAERAKRDPRFAQMHPGQQQPVAEQFLRRELQETMSLPTFEEWSESSTQMDLFAGMSR